MRLRLFTLIATLLISTACSQAIRTPYLLVKSHYDRSEIRLPDDRPLMPSTEYHKYKTDSQVRLHKDSGLFAAHTCKPGC